jgi:hypothetical protein
VDAGLIEQREAGFGFGGEVDEHVEVAVGPRVAAGDRANSARPRARKSASQALSRSIASLRSMTAL